MVNVYCKTRRISSILLVGLLCAVIKMLNIFLPGSIDRVLNPAISIVFESLALAGVIAVFKSVSKRKRRNPFIHFLFVLGMNCGWLIMFMLYLLLLVPDWIREVSVISSIKKFIQFFVTENVLTSAIIFIGLSLKSYILKPIKSAENKLSNRFESIPKNVSLPLKTSSVLLLLCLNILLQYFL